MKALRPVFLLLFTLAADVVDFIQVFTKELMLKIL